MNILLVEDDLHLGNGLRIALADEGFEPVWVRHLDGASAALNDRLIDLVLLDLGLPDGDGLAWLQHVRLDHSRLGAASPALPVLVLTARDALQERVAGLDAGADDYLVKPFALAELLSRVRALARRSYGFDGGRLVLRDLALHEPTQRVTVRGAAVELSRSEFLLLAALMKRADRVVTRRVLEEQVLPGGMALASNALDVHISNLRRKIGDGYVRTVRGVGYVVNRDAPGSDAASQGGGRQGSAW
jgi:two-component system, OmpR family, response regulator QseB